MWIGAVPEGVVFLTDGGDRRWPDGAISRWFFSLCCRMMSVCDDTSHNEAAKI